MCETDIAEYFTRRSNVEVLAIESLVNRKQKKCCSRALFS